MIGAPRSAVVRSARSRVLAPDLRVEVEALRAGARRVAGMDEVGRGALAGPVCVGLVVVDVATGPAPAGVADSKLLSPGARTALLPALSTWGVARSVGHASADEVDRCGIVGALRLAGWRALDAVSLDAPVDVVILDGSHDWLSRAPLDDLLDGVEGRSTASPVVRTLVKADQRCASVAAASVLAKCERDALMVALSAAHPAYGWAANKGYGSAEHVAALLALGPSPLHRRSWRLPGTASPAS